MYALGSSFGPEIEYAVQVVSRPGYVYRNDTRNIERPIKPHTPSPVRRTDPSRQRFPADKPARAAFPAQ
uniref:Uncharacterized protein n=1 Tax=Anopheles dirus TaxID=7168 RepID=A0A182NYC8_9DIPT